MSETPLRVLIAGGGVAALEAVLALRSLAGDRVALELLAPGGEFAHRPYSVTSPFTGEAVPRIAFDRTHVRHHRGSLAEVDPGRHVVHTTDGGELPYDRLIVALGAQPVDGVPGATLFRGPISAGAVERALAHAPERVIFTAHDIAMVNGRPEAAPGKDTTFTTVPMPTPRARCACGSKKISACRTPCAAARAR